MIRSLPGHSFYRYREWIHDRCFYASLIRFPRPLRSLHRRSPLAHTPYRLDTGKVAHKNTASFLLRLSFFDTFLWIFRFAAAPGFVVCCSVRPIFLSLCTLSTPCRMPLYTSANLLPPTLERTMSCSSIAVSFNSSVSGHRLGADTREWW